MVVPVANVRHGSSLSDVGLRSMLIYGGLEVVPGEVGPGPV